MDLSAIIKAVLTIGSNQPHRPAALLRSGDLLTGTVVKLAAGGQALMDFGHFHAWAQIHRAVRPGQRIPLEVADAGTPIKLRVRDDTGQSVKPPMPLLVTHLQDQQGRMGSRFDESSDAMLVITHHFN